MKKIIIALIILVVVAATLSANGVQDSESTYGQGPRDGRGAGQGRGTGQGRADSGDAYREDFVGELAAVYGIEPGSGVLSDSEKEGLLLMAEEEKLARDVYAKLYEKWEIPVFMNISGSEQQHMDAVLLLLEAYKIEAPSETSKAGKFDNPDLQKIYNELVRKGSESIEEAFIVGATVEDLDIADLQKLVDEAENDEVKILYQNLMKGSRNHIRSFTAQLERYDEEYKPVYISDDYYEKILKYNRETAPIADPDYSI